MLRSKSRQKLPDSIRFSEARPYRVELIDAAREQSFEGIVAKHRDSPYKPGQRSAVWQKMRVLQSRDFNEWRLYSARPEFRCDPDL